LAPVHAVEIIHKIASTLQYAHSMNIFHRDVKQENILIDASGEPHVADFGCARRDEFGATRTMEGQVMGTPAYMSPEQTSGQSHLADARSDVWSVGVMLSELLVGARPFQGSVSLLLSKICSEEATPIRQLD